jgi:hypothetical protein
VYGSGPEQLTSNGSQLLTVTVPELSNVRLGSGVAHRDPHTEQLSVSTCKNAGEFSRRSLLLNEAFGLCGADARSRGAALQRSPLVFAEAAPDTMILTSFQRPLQACVPDIASPANLLGLFNLEKGWAGIPDREEQLRVLVQTSGPVAPIHGVTLLTDCSGPLA